MAVCGGIDGPEYESPETILGISSQMGLIERNILDYIEDPSNGIEFRESVTEFELDGILFHDGSNSSSYIAYCFLDMPERFSLPDRSCLGNGYWRVAFRMDTMAVLGLITDAEYYY